MTDFLKQNPYVSREEYMWGMSVAQTRLAMYDYTHTEYLSDKQVQMLKARNNACSDVEDFAKMFGMKIPVVVKDDEKDNTEEQPN